METVGFAEHEYTSLPNDQLASTQTPPVCKDIMVVVAILEFRMRHENGSYALLFLIVGPRASLQLLLPK
jgi:hypothetical protein